MDNLLSTLDGKGRKQRIVPFSLELRKALFRYIADFNRKPDSLLFASRNETQLGRCANLSTRTNVLNFPVIHLAAKNADHEQYCTDPIRFNG